MAPKIKRRDYLSHMHDNDESTEARPGETSSPRILQRGRKYVNLEGKKERLIGDSP